MKQHREILNLWESPADLEVEICVNKGTVSVWKARNKIPAEHWWEIVKAANRRGFEITMDDFRDPPAPDYFPDLGP